MKWGAKHVYIMPQAERELLNSGSNTASIIAHEVSYIEI